MTELIPTQSKSQKVSQERHRWISPKLMTVVRSPFQNFTGSWPADHISPSYASSPLGALQRPPYWTASDSPSWSAHSPDGHLGLDTLHISSNWEVTHSPLQKGHHPLSAYTVCKWGLFYGSAKKALLYKSFPSARQHIGGSNYDQHDCWAVVFI